MLVEIAAANAAFAVIKEAVQHTGDIISAGKAMADYFSAKTEIQKKIESKPHDQRSDLEEFFALEELKQKEQELKELMIYQGRPGLWDDWLKFQSQAKRKREQAAKDAELAVIAKRERIKNIAYWTGVGFLLFILTSGSLFIVWYLLVAWMKG